MLSTSPPLPSLQPLQRLQVTDGLLLNAERWQQAHDYHLDRQNLHYQSLHQPGIVWGLGVRVIAAPPDSPAQYRDQRWLEIQPGLAIDLLGNPIVVEAPMSFRVVSEAIAEPTTIYLVLRHVDPTQLYRPSYQALLQETFRIDEKTQPPYELEIELCRLQITPGAIALTLAPDVFSPQPNQIDLRYRPQAQSRSQGSVQLAHWQNSAIPSLSIPLRLKQLLRSLPALYPALSGTEPIDLSIPSLSSSNSSIDLIYLSYSQAIELGENDRAMLKQQTQQGSLLVIELALQDSTLSELANIRQTLQQTCQDLEATGIVADIIPELKNELTACDLELQDRLQPLFQPITTLANQLGLSDLPLQPIAPDHRLKTEPFCFGQLPIVDQTEVQIYTNGSVVFIVSELSASWRGATRSREAIRTAQELGINLLHYAYHRHHLMQLQK
jgi:hypothetical protein